MSTQHTHCRCWPLVLGTLLITLGIINLLFGAGSTALAMQMADVTSQVSNEHTAIEVGKVFRKISGGMLSVGDSVIGAEVQVLLKKLPAPGVSTLFGVLRMALAVVAIVLGSGLIRRHRHMLRPLVGWCLASIALGVIALWIIGVPTARLLWELDGFMGWFTFLLDLGLHVIWPCVVFAYVGRALRSKEPLTC